MKNFNSSYAVQAVTYVLTNQCNLRCSYCFEKDKKSEFMTKEEALRISKEIDDNFRNVTLKENPRAFLDIFFFGGEPMLCGETMRSVVEYFNDKAYPVEYGITTNATLITDDDIDFFIDNNFGILVSIDGIKKVHDANRCNSYDIVKKNIGRMIDAGLKLNLEARLTIPPSSVKYMLQGVKEVFDMGIDNISPCLVYDQSWKESEWKEFDKQMHGVFDFALDTYEDTNNKRNLSIKCVNETLENCLIKSNFDEVPCGACTRNTIAISPGGIVAPCHQVSTNDLYKDSLVVGNILTDNFDMEKIKSFSAKVKLENKCSQCKYYSICSGGCRMENFRANNNFTKPLSNWCKYIKIMYQIAEEYQDRIYNAKNIRNKRLNMIKENIKFEKLLTELAHMNIKDSAILIKLAKVQEFELNKEDIIFSSFHSMSKLVFDLLHDEILCEALKLEKEIENV